MIIIFNENDFKNKIERYRNEFDYEKTIELCGDMIRFGEKNNHYRALVESYFQRGVAYYNIGDIKNAFNDLMYHKELIDEEGTNEDLLNSYNFIFVLHLYNEDYDKCKETLTGLINLCNRIDNKVVLSNAYSNYSHVLNLECAYEEALTYAEKSYRLAMRHNSENEGLVIRGLINLVKAYICLGKLEESKSYLDKIKEMKILKENKRISIFYYNLNANYFYKNNNKEKALDYYKESINLLEEYNDNVLLQETYEAVIQIYNENKDYKNLAFTQKLYIDLMHKIKEEELDQLTRSLEIQHQVKERHKRYKIIEEKNKMLELSNKKIIEQSEALESYYDQLWGQYNDKDSESKRDFLTGIFNRQGIEEKLEEIVFYNKLEKTSISCLMFDIDYFKKVNDTYGHLAGDKVIKKTAELCLEMIGERYVFGRYGGDEFVAIMEFTNLSEAKKMAEKIINAVKNNKIYIEDQDKEIKITLSVGVMNTRYHMISDIKDMIYIADLGLYSAKRKGRNQYDVYEENYNF